MNDYQNALARILAWRTLALRFLDSMNPQLDKAIVIANAVVDYDGMLDDPLRHNAYRFIRAAERIIDQEQSARFDDYFELWIQGWNDKYGVHPTHDTPPPAKSDKSVLTDSI